MPTHVALPHVDDADCKGLWDATLSDRWPSGVDYVRCSECGIIYPGSFLIIEIAQHENAMACLFDNLAYEGYLMLHGEEE
jgi:hypothetical protein